MIFYVKKIQKILKKRRMNRDIHYKLQGAYKELGDWVRILGDELQRNYEYRDEIREIQDIDHDEIESLNNELEKRNKKRRNSFNFYINEIRESLNNVELHYDILEKYFRSREEALQTLSNLQQLQQEEPSEKKKKLN